ncbi:mynd finger family protein [Stemphylium lycopersici]|nr:mynd finger family protein [Stemphylium lycopersici]
MTTDIPGLSTLSNLLLCSNTKQEPCQAHAALYCSKKCQTTDWSHHKKGCKSPFLKGTWEPEWYRSGRQPAFIREGPPLAMFGNKKYLWGNMPALDILQLQNNESKTYTTNHDFNLLFAASGDLRNTIKTIAGLPEGYKGKCVAVLNDMDIIIVARNAIMLLIALQFESDVAVPMIIHLWYSALLPSYMMQAIQTSILPMVKNVCQKIKTKPGGTLQAKTFEVGGRKLRITLKKEEWACLAKFCQVPEGLTAEAAQRIRHSITLAPERVDYRDRALLNMPAGVRQGEMYFRHTGVLLPYGCSTRDFDTPNPRLRSSNISFQLFNMDARDIGRYLDDMKFDRIEISNICDRGFVGPHTCLQVFSQLLKSISQNPKATLLMLFINAAIETDNTANPQGDVHSMVSAMKRLENYIPFDKSRMNLTRSGTNTRAHPDLILRTACYDMFKPWDKYFDMFMDEAKMIQFATLCGMAIKEKHTIVQPWPYKIQNRTTKKEFDVLRAGCTTGFERYMEFQKLETVADNVHRLTTTTAKRPTETPK